MKFTLLGASTKLSETLTYSPRSEVDYDSEEELLADLSKTHWHRDGNTLFYVVTIVKGGL